MNKGVDVLSVTVQLFAREVFPTSELLAHLTLGVKNSWVNETFVNFRA